MRVPAHEPRAPRLRFGLKVAAATLGAVTWIGAIAAQAADAPDRSAAAAARMSLPAAAFDTTTAGPADSIGQLDRVAKNSTSPSTTTETVDTAPPAVTAQASQTPATAAKAAPPSGGNTPRQGGSAAGGSMSGTSPVSQAYAQTTQAGWGCQAALQYLSQHANPEFKLVCPGYAMGHQAMTCYYLQGECPDSAEIVIADPCPAAYENEAWNSWHMGSGPYDPYGWCSDWSPSRGGPTTPIP
jgi:hypothetical protein